MAHYQVTCITKPDRQNSHEAITHLGGAFGYWPVEEVILAIESERHSFYTDDGRKQAMVKVRKNERTGRKYVQTYADNDWNDNLLALPACSTR